MPNINDAFPSNYLKASDLKGAQPVVTIDRVEFEPVGQKREMKPILYFVGKDKGLVLNKTNASKIMQITESPVTEEWQGHTVCLFATHVEFQGDTVEAIRVKAATRQARSVPVTPPPVQHEPIDADDVPF